MPSLLAALVLSAALGAAPAPRPARADPAARAQAWATELCRTASADPINPWALAHGVGTFGPGFRAADGRLAIDAMLADSVRQLGPGLYRLPEKMGSVPVDPHANHTVATLVAAGVPTLRTFKTRGGEVTLGALAESVRDQFIFTADDDFWRRQPWTLGLLGALTPEDRATFRTRAGEEVDLNTVFDAGMAYLARSNRFLAEARAEGVTMMTKARQGPWAHACGGLHLVESVLGWAGDNKAFRARHQATIEEQIDVLFYRVDLETLIYDDAEHQAPEYALQFNVQRLKFYGHWLEVMSHLQSQKLWKPTPARRRTLAKARARLTRAIEALAETGADRRMAEFKKSMPQTYLDLIGDTCHAATGLKHTR